MRSYGQYCALARTLDVVGDRWILLIVRELLIRGACRYTDLMEGLPGIATNLLATRLREMEDAGIVTREQAPPPVPTALFRLTPRGRELESAIELLGAWGAPLLGAPKRTDTFRGHWLWLPLKNCLRDTRPDEPDIRIEVRAGGTVLTVTASHGKVSVDRGAGGQPDAIVEGAARAVAALMIGKLSLSEALKSGVKYSGRRTALTRVRTGATAESKRKKPRRGSGATS